MTSGHVIALFTFVLLVVMALSIMLLAGCIQNAKSRDKMDMYMDQNMAREAAERYDLEAYLKTWSSI